MSDWNLLGTLGAMFLGVLPRLIGAVVMAVMLFKLPSSRPGRSLAITGFSTFFACFILQTLVNAASRLTVLARMSSENWREFAAILSVSSMLLSWIGMAGLVVMVWGLCRMITTGSD